MAYYVSPSLPLAFENNSDMIDELMILKEIYLDELTVEESCEPDKCLIKLPIHPATGEHIDKRWVAITIIFTIHANYPHNPPKISLTNPRGISEEHYNSLLIELDKLAHHNVGCPMLYDLIEHARESLTNNNTPSTQCMICMECFDDVSDKFTKTTCYHYFHVHCLQRYKSFIHRMSIEQVNDPSTSDFHLNGDREKQVIACPVCRQDISNDINSLQFDDPISKPRNHDYLDKGHKNNESYKHHDEDDDVFVYVPSESVIKLQERMKILFEKQKKQGGIIDLEEERNKYLIPSRPSQQELYAVDRMSDDEGQ